MLKSQTGSCEYWDLH